MLTGSLEVLVIGEDRSPLPGATVTMSGTSREVRQTDASGRCLFAQLAPGGWSLECALDGYSTLEFPGAMIRVGQIEHYELTLSLAIIDDWAG